MDEVNISDKRKLENGDDYFLIERNFLNVDNANIKINNNPKFTIKIGQARKPISTATILLTKEDDYVGHISANLYDNGTASLLMSGIRGVEFPEELSKYSDIMEKHDTALLVADKYRRQGKATLLMKLMFQYLNKKGIKDLEVHGITNDIAMQTYLSTGAEMTGNRKAIYRDIKRFIQKEKSEDMEK